MCADGCDIAKINCTYLSQSKYYVVGCYLLSTYIYKDEMLSVRLSAVFSGMHVALWFLRGLTPDLLDMKRLSLGNMKTFLKSPRAQSYGTCPSLHDRAGTFASTKY